MSKCTEALPVEVPQQRIGKDTYQLPATPAGFCWDPAVPPSFFGTPWRRKRPAADLHAHAGSF